MYSFQVGPKLGCFSKYLLNLIICASTYLHFGCCVSVTVSVTVFQLLYVGCCVSVDMFLKSPGAPWSCFFSRYGQELNKKHTPAHMCLVFLLQSVSHILSLTYKFVACSSEQVSTCSFELYHTLGGTTASREVTAVSRWQNLSPIHFPKKNLNGPYRFGKSNLRPFFSVDLSGCTQF